jgi:dynein heavy chain
VKHLYANTVDNTGMVSGLVTRNSYCHSYFVLRYRFLLDEMETEIRRDYNQSLRKAILDYILLDPEGRKHLNIHTYPTDYPSIAIRAPVPWHSTFVISSHVLHHKLFIVNPILLCLRDLWEFQ